MLPIYPKNENYGTGYHYERLADLFEHHFNNFDIICLQEVFGLMTGELKEIFVTYAQKAGFLYIAPSNLCQPAHHSLYFCDSGLLILSRFPIVEQDFQQFSLGVFSDGEVKRGVLYSKI